MKISKKLEVKFTHDIPSNSYSIIRLDVPLYNVINSIYLKTDGLSNIGIYKDKLCTERIYTRMKCPTESFKILNLAFNCNEIYVRLEAENNNIHVIDCFLNVMSIR